MVETKKQWYEEAPKLLEAENAAMEYIAKDDNKKFGFLKDGRAYWNVGFRSRLSSRKYSVALIYPQDHPCHRFVGFQGLWVYPIEPTYKALLDEMNASSGEDDECMSYSVRDGEGKWNLSLCETEIAYKSGWMDSRRSGIVSAANVLLATKEWIEFYEKGIANHGVGFYRFTTINPTKERQACIDYFGAPAVEYYRKKSNNETS